MNLHNIKQQSIVDYLQQQGYSPQHTRGNSYWYCSPLRNEQTASFKVNAERNQWYDFATGEHGDIIDLVCILQHCSIAEAMKHLSSASNTFAVRSSTRATPSFSFGGTSIPAAPPAHHMELVSVKPLTHPKLLQYLAERGLKKSDVFSFLWEISYKTSDKTFFALGFANDAGGWELRNPYFKGCMSPKSISTIKGKDGQQLQIFEGFMDFLSWRKLHPEINADSIVLNSLALLPKIIPLLTSYTSIECFLDNDVAGRKAFDQLKCSCPRIIDGSVRYQAHKDLNEWLVAQSKLKEKQVLLPTTKRGIRR
jgi:mobilizable transposon, excision protein